MSQEIAGSEEVVPNPTKASNVYVQNQALTPLEKVESAILGGGAGAIVGAIVTGAPLSAFIASVDLGASTFLGAKAGAVLGSPLGIPGIIAGTAIGAVVGAFFVARGEIRKAGYRKQAQTS